MKNFYDSELSQKIFAPLLTLTLISFCVISIFNSRTKPILDQKSLIEFSFKNGYPSVEHGITSWLIVASLDHFKQYVQFSLDTITRVFAAVLYLISGSLLTWSLSKLHTHNITFFSLFFLLLSTSRFSFLWLSSELFVGAFLMLIFWSTIEDHSFLLTAFWISLFSLSKPDLLLPGIMLGAFLAWSRSNMNNWGKVASVAIIIWMIVTLILPGIALSGFGYLFPYGRGLVSFCQHYADLVSKYQITSSPPDPWLKCEVYLSAKFGDVQNIADVIVANPVGYMDYLFLSVSESLRRAAAGNLLLLAPIAVLGLVITHNRRLKIAVILVAVANLILIVLLSYLHVRYQARFYPLALIATSFGINELKLKQLRKTVIFYLVFLLLVQAYASIPVFSSGYYFPD